MVPTTHPWPAAKAVLEILLPQCGADGIEIILADSTGEGLPANLPAHFRDIRHVVVHGASVFDLRAKGTETARGSIVAWTEDHCRPASDWCACTIRAHEEHPEAEVIGGAVLNGSVTNAMDWSNFLCTFGPFLPPLPEYVPRAPVAANVSFKRRVIPEGALRQGVMEFSVLGRLWNQRRVHLDGRILVHHVQSWGFWGSPRAHFHNGRTTTGLSRWPLRRKLRRMLHCPILPIELLQISAGAAMGKPDVPVWRCLPHMTALAMAHAAGEFVGLLAGPGRSPVQLE